MSSISVNGIIVGKRTALLAGVVIGVALAVVYAALYTREDFERREGSILSGIGVFAGYARPSLMRTLAA